MPLIDDTGLKPVDSHRAEIEERVTSMLGEMEAHVRKRPSKFVLLEGHEIDFLVLVERMRDMLSSMTHCHDTLQHVFGAPYTKIARCRYLLETVPLCENRASDRRWEGLRRICDVVEGVIRDIDGSRFRNWQQLKSAGLFQPSFDDPDAASDGEEENEEEEASTRQTLMTAMESMKNIAALGPPSEQALAFCLAICGPRAQITNEGRTLARDAGGNPGFAAEMIEGLGRAMRRADMGAGTALYHARKKFSAERDDGATALSAAPLQRFPGLGQYAEVVISATAGPKALYGCVGIGVTRLGPAIWESVGKNELPKKLDSFPGPSWIFGGPYRGSTRRLYVHGKKEFRYNLPDERWQEGDRVGILARPDGKLALYLNRTHLVTTEAPGLQELNVDDADLWLVVEAYGYVMSLSLEVAPDPRDLEIIDKHIMSMEEFLA